MTTICLTMIVKNEAHTIRRCLASLQPWIDHWVIVDTGSEDGTQEVIREYLQGVPGTLHERPWVDFAHNRTEAIALARPHADYLFFMDADEVLVVPEGMARPHLTEDAYQVAFHYGNLVYCRPNLVATRLDWAFEGVLHEYLVCRDQPGLLVTRRWEGPHIQVFPEGARSRDPDKYKRDAALLEKALAKEPDNARYAFYLAQSYRDAGEPALSLAAYERRATMPGSLEETWHALYQIARLKEQLASPETEVINAYLKAHACRPQRAEVLGSLARYLRLRGRYREAVAFAAQGLALPMTTDILFVEVEHYQWLCLDEYAVATYWTGQYRASAEACDRLLAEPHLPARERERVQANRAFALQAQGGQGALLGEAPALTKLNLGCAGKVLPGWLNVALRAAPGVDLVVDLEACEQGRIPLADNAVDALQVTHVLERLRNPLPLLQDLHRLTRPGGLCTLRLPYGSSDDAWEDPAHQRPYFLKSFDWFGQPGHGCADQGYRGDWAVEQVELTLNDPSLRDRPLAELQQAVRDRRNLVTEMVVTLRCVKPIRAPLAELRKPAPVVYRF